jgi:hypothetical protein
MSCFDLALDKFHWSLVYACCFIGPVLYIKVVLRDGLPYG